MKKMPKINAVKKIAVRSALVLAVVGFIAGSAFLVVRPPSFLKVKEVVVMTPLKHLNEYDLIRLSEVQKGDPILKLSLNEVRERLLRFPWIKDVQLSKRIPARLLIWVEEQEPVALLDVFGSFYLVNRDGKVFKKLEAQDKKDLPILAGFDDAEIGSRLPQVVNLMATLDQADLLGGLGISEIHWNKMTGLTLFTKEPCIRLELGENDKEDVIVWVERLKKFSQSWAMIQSETNRPQVVDLSIDRKLIVKQGF